MSQNHKTFCLLSFLTFSAIELLVYQVYQQVDIDCHTTKHFHNGQSFIL